MSRETRILPTGPLGLGQSVCGFDEESNQFATAPLCRGPFTPDSANCVTIIRPVPLGNSH
jgi:hypothetical protein